MFYTVIVQTQRCILWWSTHIWLVQITESIEKFWKKKREETVFAMWSRHSTIMYSMYQNRRMVRLLSTLTRSIENASSANNFLSPTTNIYRWQMDRSESNYFRRLFSDSSEVRILGQMTYTTNKINNINRIIQIKCLLLTQSDLMLLKPNSKKYAFYDLDGEPQKWVFEQMIQEFVDII